jgi:hypothetical protein
MTSISQERNKLAAVGMRLRRREEWGARFDYTNSRPVDEPATRVFVHISVTNPRSYSSRDAHARAIESIGISRFPATGISYNRLIFAGTDTVYEGQPIGRRGAHTVNDLRVSTCLRFGSACPGYKASLTAPSWNLNVNSRAYVIAQNIDDPVTEQMVNALARAIAADAKAGFVTEYAALHPHGHRCVSTKSCPGNLMWARMGLLKTKIAARLSELSSGSGSGGGVTIPPPTGGGGIDLEDDLNEQQAKQLADIHTLLTGATAQWPAKLMDAMARVDSTMHTEVTELWPSKLMPAMARVDALTAAQNPALTALQTLVQQNTVTLDQVLDTIDGVDEATVSALREALG